MWLQLYVRLAESVSQACILSRDQLLDGVDAEDAIRVQAMMQDRRRRMDVLAVAPIGSLAG